MKRKRHSQQEVAEKLRQASALAAQGNTQPVIAKALGISVMTYHRWRKDQAPAVDVHPPQTPLTLVDHHGERRQMARISELQAENARLRRLVTDLLLEKARLEEVLDRATPSLAAG